MPDKKKQKVLYVRVSEELHERVLEKCEQQKRPHGGRNKKGTMSVNELIVGLLEKEFGSNEDGQLPVAFDANQGMPRSE